MRTSIEQVKAPDERLTFRAIERETGEILECRDLVPLLRNITRSFRHWDASRPTPRWTIDLAAR